MIWCLSASICSFDVWICSDRIFEVYLQSEVLILCFSMGDTVDGPAAASRTWRRGLGGHVGAELWIWWYLWSRWSIVPLVHDIATYVQWIRLYHEVYCSVVQGRYCQYSSWLKMDIRVNITDPSSPEADYILHHLLVTQVSLFAGFAVYGRHSCFS